MNARQLRDLANVFNGYRHPVDDYKIREWIGQFSHQDEAIAEKVLNHIDFYTSDRISASFRNALGSLEGWDIDAAKRKGKWRFVPYSASAGESGDTMLHKFRHANNLSNRRYNELFISRSDLLREGLGPEDSVVLVDDFIGSGEQASTSWKEIFGELLGEVGRVYLLVVCAYSAGIEKVREETDLDVVCGFIIGKSANVFSGSGQRWSTIEKDALLKYCKKASKAKPKGHGECGLLVVFSHGCPNNSIAVLHSKSENWEPLFRRYD